MNSKTKKGNNKLARIGKAIIDESINIDNLGTTCIFYYQPKVPKGIDKLKKSNNDK